MSRPMLFPVYGFGDHSRPEALATFFSSSDAETFAMHPERDGFERRNVYLAEPRYDRRTRGYRPPERPTGYAEWLASLALAEPVSGDPFPPQARAA